MKKGEKKSYCTGVVRAVAFMGVALVLIGSCVYCRGIVGCIDGKYTEFDRYDREIVFDPAPILGTRAGFARLDASGTLRDAEAALGRLDATEVFRETVGDATVIYARSPRVERSVVLSGEEINVMVAVRGDRITIGSPLIKGSF